MVGEARDTARDLVVVGASAGGVEALQRLVAGFPADLPASVFVVLHIPRTGRRLLAAILDRAGPLRAVDAQDGASPAPGVIYVAPADHHLVLRDGRIGLTQDEAVNHHRPSVDALFGSAESVGPRVIAIVLSGSGDDGSRGMLAATAAGAIGIVQHPDEAGYPSMPNRALQRVPAALVSRVDELGALVARLATGLSAAPS